MNTPSPDSELLCIVRQSLKSHGVFGGNDSVLIAVSGGADSVAMLDLLAALQGEYGLSLAVAHLDHGLRGKASEADRRFVENLAEEKGLRCYSGFRDVGAYRKENRLSLEEAAREVRYDFLFETADKQGFSKIATAHHAGDNAELVLMNLMRGSGPAGLGGMEVVSRDGRLIRPLLEVQRSHIMDYVKVHGLTFREDLTNRDKAYLRNRIRLELLPLIESAYRKGFVRTVSRTARIIREDEEWMDTIAGPAYGQAVRDISDRKVRLDVAVLKDFHAALRRRVIRKALLHVKGNLLGIGFVHVEDAVRLVDHVAGRASLDLPGCVRVKMDRGLLSVTKEAGRLRRIPPFEDGEPPIAFEYTVDKPRGRSVDVTVPEAGVGFRFSHIRGALPHGERTQGRNTACLDMDRLTFPLSIRNPRPGDRFMPLGMTGHQKVSRFFSHAKIPWEQRQRACVLISDSRIVWVCGYRIDEAAKVNPSTENILKVELFLA